MWQHPGCVCAVCAVCEQAERWWFVFTQCLFRWAAPSSLARLVYQALVLRSTLGAGHEDSRNPARPFGLLIMWVRTAPRHRYDRQNLLLLSACGSGPGKGRFVVHSPSPVWRASDIPLALVYVRRRAWSPLLAHDVMWTFAGTHIESGGHPGLPRQ